MRVCIILNPTFGAQLRSLDKSSPIWVVQSSANAPVIAELWKSKTGNITSFCPQDFGQLLDTIDQHHPGWLELDVYGLSAADGTAALAEYGNGDFAPLEHGFRFRRATAEPVE